MPGPGGMDRILDNCSDLVPRLRTAKIISQWVGLRPVRTKGVRLELEDRQGIKVLTG